MQLQINLKYITGVQLNPTGQCKTISHTTVRKKVETDKYILGERDASRLAPVLCQAQKFIWRDGFIFGQDTEHHWRHTLEDRIHAALKGVHGWPTKSIQLIQHLVDFCQVYKVQNSILEYQIYQHSEDSVNCCGKRMLLSKKLIFYTFDKWININFCLKCLKIIVLSKWVPEIRVI